MKREGKWELLRAISCISVVLLHVAALYTEEVQVYQHYPNISFSFCDFIQIITRTAVPCFVMLSGAFMLDKQHLNVVEFYKKSLPKLIIPTLLFEIFYMMVSVFGGNSVAGALHGALTGNIAGHLWFMFMMMGLYITFPLLYFIKQNIDHKMFVVFSLVMVLFSCIIHFSYELPWAGQCLEFIGYFLMGNLIRKIGKELPGSVRSWILLSFGFLLITFILNEYQFYHGTYDPTFFRNPNFPTVIIASLSIFVAFSKAEVNHIPNVFQKLAKHSMVIYMLHPFVINVICKVAKKLCGGWLPTPFIYVPFLIIVCLLLTYAGACVLDYIKNKTLKAIS